MKTPVELAKAQEELAETAAHVMDNMIIENKETKGTSICRERFLDASVGKNVYPENGENLIENSNLNSYEVQVTCPYNLTYCLGYKCKVESIAEKLQVAEIEYSYNSKGEETKLILRRCK